MDIPMLMSLCTLAAEYALMAWQMAYTRVYPYGYDTGLAAWYKKVIEEQAAALEAQAGQIGQMAGQIEAQAGQIEDLEAQVSSASSSTQRHGTPI